MPAIKVYEEGGNQSCRHRSGSAINGFEDANTRYHNNASDPPIANETGTSAIKEVVKTSESVDQFEMQSYVQRLRGSCRKCGLVWPVQSNSMLNPSAMDSQSNGTSNGKAVDENSEETSPKKLVMSRVSYFEERMSIPEESKGVQNGFAEPIVPEKRLVTRGLEPNARDHENSTRKNFPKKSEAGSSSKTGGCPFSGGKELKNIRLKNYVKGSQNMDNLHLKAKATHCSSNRCMGSLMQPYGGVQHENRPHGVVRAPDQIKEHAVDFMEQYFSSLKKINSDAHKERIDSIYAEIEEKGTYDLTYDELLFGAKVAWRNAPRCIGRIQWNNIKLFDARNVTTAKGMFDAVCEHLDYATNGGNLRSTITVFRQRMEGVKDMRIWNSQLIRYAGYDKEDGSVVGDPASIEFTKLCEKLGWNGPGGHFDILPLIFEPAGEPPQVFNIPEELALQVSIKHPEYPWFEELGLKWYALPAVANMALDVGGIEFPAAPFNGWYMVTEVGARDLGDAARYNMLEPIAQRMNLDTRTNTSLWKDRAVTELNHAVLYSFGEAKVTITDHHTASETFIKHMENEQKLRGGCPADWVWIVPPSNGSTTEVFHQEMLNYVLKPSYDYQPDAWRHYKFDDANETKLTFKQAAIMVKLVNRMMNGIMAKREKATILYATETGKSEGFAKMLQNLFSQAFDVKLFCMDEYDFSRLGQETMLLVVTSTFGNGEAPMNGEKFGDTLFTLQNPEESDDQEMRSLSNTTGKILEQLKFAVFGLGSRAYPSFCSFAHSCRKLLKELGGKEIHLIGEGDELCGQEESFKKWASNAFKSACDVFSIDQSNLKTADGMGSSQMAFDPKRYRFQYEEADLSFDLYKGLSEVHGKQVSKAKVISVEELQSNDSGRSTILVKLSGGNKKELRYEPGDHLSIFPCNESAIVDKLLGQLTDAPYPDSPIRIEINNANGSNKQSWEILKRLPTPCTLRNAFTSFIDITMPPSQEMLKILAKQAIQKIDQERLEKLAEDSEAYEDWKFEKYSNITEVIDEFPSLRLNGLELLTQLPILQGRYYSISSSPLMFPDEIHGTVAVVCYETEAEPKKIHHGVCSYWLSSLKPGDDVPCYVRQATNFRLPKDNSSPVIMVGPGTGIAPLRSFWQQRQKMRGEGSSAEWGSMDLYFGCRSSKHDNLFAEEKERARVDGTLANVHLALSREPGVQKTYVQHLIKRNSRDVCDKLFKRNGHLYVCGDVAMAAEVGTALSEIVQENLHLSKEQARTSIKKLKTSGHYHEDIFGVTKISARSKHLDK